MALVPTSSILINTFSPSSIQGLAAWYDAYDPRFIRYNNSSISTLIDKSGNRSNTINLPSMGAGNTNLINYLINTLSNNGNSLVFTSNISTGSLTNSPKINIGVITRLDWSWFVLLKTNYAGPGGPQWYSGKYIIDGEIGGVAAEMGMSILNTGRLACGCGGPDVTVASGIVTDGNFQMCEFLRYYRNGEISAYTNGQNYASSIGPLGPRNAVALTTLAIGNGRGITTVTTQAFQGYMYEILMFSTFLSTAARQQVEGYLAWKWGFPGSLPAAHPYRNNPFIVSPDPTPISIPSNTFIVPINTFSSIKTFTFPPANTNSGQMIILKDYFGYANRNFIYLSTQGTDTFRGFNIGRTSTSSNAILSTAYGSWTFENDGTSNWFVTSRYNNTLPTYQVDVVYPSGPSIYLNPATSTFFPTPIYNNVSTFPINMGSYFNFSGTSQFLNLSSLTFNSGTNGFAIKTKIMWTQVASWSRIAEFNIALPFAFGAGSELFTLTRPAVQCNVLLFYYRNTPVSATSTDSYFTYLFSTNVIYNLTVNYIPSSSLLTSGPFGAVTFWINGDILQSNTLLFTRMRDATCSNAYFGASVYASDALLSARIYKMAVYDRYLSDTECAYQW